MNNVNLIGRLTADPEVSFANNDDKTQISKFTLAVDRVTSGEADFIRCVAFGKAAQFAEDYFKKGQRVGVTGRIQTGSYDDKDGKKVYTTDVIVEHLDFADGKKDDQQDRGRSRGSRR